MEATRELYWNIGHGALVLVPMYLFTFAALGLLFMTVIVELTVPEGWPVHITWAAMALGIMAWGPGRFSTDHLTRNLFHLPELDR